MSFTSDMKDLIQKAEEQPENWEPVLRKIVSRFEPAIKSIQFTRIGLSSNQAAYCSIELAANSQHVSFSRSSPEQRWAQEILREAPPGITILQSKNSPDTDITTPQIAVKIYEHKAAEFLYIFLFKLTMPVSPAEQDSIVTNIKDALEPLIPLLHQAIELSCTYSMSPHGELWQNTLIENNKSPAIILDQTGRIEYANLQALSFLEDQTSGLRENSKGLLSFRNKSSQAIPSLIDQVLNNTIETYTAVSLNLDKGVANDVLILSRLGPPQQDNPWRNLFSPPPRILAIVRSGSVPIAISPELIKNALGLTNREADLAAALANGLKVEEYAETAGVKRDTVRWHLKQILNKTGCRSQTDLVRRILYQFSILDLY